MKKLLMLVALVGLSVGLVGCGDDEKKPAPSTTTPGTTTPASK